VINPADTRKVLARSLEMLATKHEELPPSQARERAAVSEAESAALAKRPEPDPAVLAVIAASLDATRPRTVVVEEASAGAFGLAVSAGAGGPSHSPCAAHVPAVTDRPAGALPPFSGPWPPCGRSRTGGGASTLPKRPSAHVLTRDR